MPLTHPELLALATAARHLMTADGALDDEEFEAVAGFAAKLDLTPGQWEAVWDEAVRAGADPVAAAGSVERTEAREQIYELLYGLAMEGTIVDPEWDLLEWIDEVWCG